MLYLLYSGLLHSDICGSILACNSPQLFAAYRVLRRLPMPRHPPCALISLTFFQIQIMLLIAWSFWNCSFPNFWQSYLKTKLFFLIAFTLLLYSIFKIRFVSLFTYWWAQMDSNHRPHAYQACALTTWAMRPYDLSRSFLLYPFGGDEEDRTPDPLLAKQVLSQLSYTPTRLSLEPIVLNFSSKLHLTAR